MILSLSGGSDRARKQSQIVRVRSSRGQSGYKREALIDREAKTPETHLASAGRNLHSVPSAGPGSTPTSPEVPSSRKDSNVTVQDSGHTRVLCPSNLSVSLQSRAKHRVLLLAPECPQTGFEEGILKNLPQGPLQIQEP